MLSKRKLKTLSGKSLQRAVGKHTLYCKECDSNPKEVSLDISKFTCSFCVQRMVAPPENYRKSEHEGYQRGWHFKKRYEAPDGKVYAFGKLIEEDGELTEEQVSTDSPPTKKTRKTKATTKKVTKRTRKKRDTE